jgi:hypothetical protein
MECGLDHVVQALPRRTFLGEHAVRPEEELPDLLRQRGLHEDISATHVDRVHDVGVPHEVPITVDDARTDDVAVVLVKLRYEADLVLLEAEGRADDGQSLASWDRARGARRNFVLLEGRGGGR